MSAITPMHIIVPAVGLALGASIGTAASGTYDHGLPVPEVGGLLTATLVGGIAGAVGGGYFSNSFHGPSGAVAGAAAVGGGILVGTLLANLLPD